MSLAQREFSHADQMRFASVSGDRNPMHIDALAARRTQAGEPVIHGIHMLLWALDSLAVAQPGLPPLRSLRAQFNNFVYLGEQVEVILAQQSASSARLLLSVEGAPRLKIVLELGDADCHYPHWSGEPLESRSIPAHALDLRMDEIAACSGRLPFQMRPEDALALFPAAARWVGPQRIAALAATTLLVGMVCPGLHSIYRELSISACSESALPDALAFRVTDTDPRFHSIKQEIAGGGLIGNVKSFVRTPPAQQRAMASLKGLLAPDEFSGAIALIVGGSRGLGELTAKLIATGGGHVIVTWKAGRDDAQRVADEILSAGGACEILNYDACKPAMDQLASLPTAPTHAYYFATPAIFRPQAEIFAAARLKEFLAVYVEGFWDLVQVLRSRQQRLSIFYPSSVAVTERPKGMTDYTMAKAAGEVLSADINAFLAPMHVTVSRLPRLPTDQTATVTDVETADPLDIMLPIVREVQSRPR